MFGYPLLTLILAAVVNRRVDKRPVEPSVTFLIAAYNEAAHIAEKLRETVALDYPQKKLEIMVVSDGSSDGTDDIVRAFNAPNVRLCRVEGRRGKTEALNQAIEQATGEILVFSDATGEFSRNAIRELTANFADPAIGCVTGRVAYRYGKDQTSRGFSGYQKVAVAVRRAESRFASQTSVSGSIHAMRRSLYRRSDPAFSLDVIDAVHTVAAGYRVVYENEAVSLEESRQRIADEFRCRVRIAVRGASMVPYILRSLLGRGRIGYLFQMISHKILRWYLWLWLLIALVSSAILALQGGFYVIAFLAQAAGYGLAVFGLIAGSRQVRLPLLSTLSFFVMANAAMAFGAIKALFGQRMPRWEPVR